MCGGRFQQSAALLWCKPPMRADSKDTRGEIRRKALAADRDGALNGLKLIIAPAIVNKLCLSKIARQRRLLSGASSVLR
jgi:hypothetical protein